MELAEGERACKQCGVVFRHYGIKLYCSKECELSRVRKNYPHQPCKVCGTLFQPKSSRAVYCNPRCKYADERPKSLWADVAIPTTTIGAMNELRVAMDLMAKGYHVFRALSPSGPCDLIAFRPAGPVLRIEVRTAMERMGKLFFSKDHADQCEHFAVVVPERIVYVPDLPED